MTSNSISDLLRAALALIDHPDRWCQHSSYQDDEGNTFSEEDGSFVATKRCGEGACATAATGIVQDKSRIVSKMLDALGAAVGYSLFYAWQDAPGRTYADVVAAFHRAIAIADAYVAGRAP